MKSLKHLNALFLFLIYVVIFSACSDQDFVVVAEKPLRVLYITPNDGSANIPLESTISVTFSEEVDDASIKNSENFFVTNITDERNPVKIEGVIVYDESKKTAVFTPSSKFSYSQTYAVTLSSKIKKKSEKKYLPMEIKTRFSTINPDMLHIVSSNPAGGAWEVPINKSITINFSHPVDTNSIVYGTSFLVEDITNESTPVTINPKGESGISWSEDKKVLTFIPEKSYGYSKLIKVTLSKEIKSVEGTNAGGHLADSVVIPFKTINPSELSIIGVETESGKLIMDRDDKIIVKFSEGVKQSSVTIENFIVEDVTGLLNPENEAANSVIDGTISWNGEDAANNDDLIGTDNILTFTPKELLPYGTLVRVRILGSDEAAKTVIQSDRASEEKGYLRESFTYIFGVVRLPELFVVSTNPGHNARSVEHGVNTISVTLSAAPDCSRINEQFIQVTYDKGTFADDPIDSEGDEISGSWSCTENSPEIIFTADKEFGYGRDILVHLSSEVADSKAKDDAVSQYDPSQGHLEPEYNFGFGTEHLNLVNVISSNAAGSSAFDIKSNIIVTFDKPVKCSTVKDSTFYINQGESSDIVQKLEAVIVCNGESSTTVELDPTDKNCTTGGLCYNTTYTFTFSGGASGICVPEKDVLDLSGDGCIKAPGLSFTFKTAPEPEFTASIEPKNNALGVSLNAKPKITFSAPVLAESIENDAAGDDGITPNICLVKGQNVFSCDSSDKVDVEYQLPEPSVVLLVPKSSLSPEQFYTVVVSIDVKNSQGKKLSGFYTSTFKTTPGGLIDHVDMNDEENINIASFQIYFTEDIDTDSISEASLYVTFENEFGGTTKIPVTFEFTNWHGNGICNPLISNEFCDSVILTPDFISLYACGESAVSPMFELPLNTIFKLYVNTLIRNAAFETKPELIKLPLGENEYTFNFTSPSKNLIKEVKYENSVVAATNLENAGEVPVNSRFIITFEKNIDQDSINGETILIEDRRGSDGIAVNGTSQFKTASKGMFTSNDIGKYIEIFTSQTKNGRYKIASVSDNQTVVLSGVTFNADETNLYWSKTLDSTLFSFAVDGKSVIVTPNKNLEYHSDYSGFNAEVASGTNIVTIPATKENFKVSASRDIGKILVVSGSSSGNNSVRNIISVDEANNKFTVDGAPFASAEQNLRWNVYSSDDYHRLIIKGRSRSNKINYIQDIEGNPLPGTAYYKFTTSPETYGTVTSAKSGINVLQSLAVVYSRPLNPDSLSAESLYISQNNVKNTSLISFTPLNPYSAQILPVPALSETYTATLYSTSKVEDYRGNPVSSISKNYTVAGAPATSAITPNVPLTITPTAASQIKGDQVFTITWPDGGSNQKYTILPASINNESIKLDQILDSGADGSTSAGSAVFTVTKAGAFTDAKIGMIIETGSERRKITEILSGTQVTLDSSFSSNSSNISWKLISEIPLNFIVVPYADSNMVKLYPAEAKSIKTGNGSIRLTVFKSKISNMYTIASTDPDVVNSYTVETTAPTVLAATALLETGSGNLSGANNVKPDTKISVIMSESIDLSSLDGKIQILDKNNNVKPLSYKLINNVIEITPDSYLKSSGNPYTFKIFKEITDTAGNKMAADYIVVFSVETNLPTVVSQNPANGSASVSVNSTFDFVFSEVIDISTLYTPTKTTSGTFEIENTLAPAACDDFDGKVYGCVSLDKSGKKVTFVPYPRFVDMIGSYSGVIKSDIADLAGNKLAANYEFGFETTNDLEPILPEILCADLPDAAKPDKLSIYFNNIEIDMATVTNGSFIVFEAQTGNIVNGTFSSEVGDSGYPVIKFTASAPFVSGTVYGIAVTTEIKETNGNKLAQSYHKFFTMP